MEVLAWVAWEGWDYVVAVAVVPAKLDTGVGNRNLHVGIFGATGGMAQRNLMRAGGANGS